MDRVSIGRRGFMKVAGLGAAGLAVTGGRGLAAPTLRTGRLVPPDQRLNVACVGVSGKGSSDVDGVRDENIVALCDVDYSHGAGAFSRFPKAERYKDYRKMLKEMDDVIDAVTVSTPDHMHFPIAMMAIEMGKHVFVQKPLTHTVWEAREITQAARRHKVQTQMGIQGHSGEGIRLLKEWLDAGAIGEVHEIQYWTNRPIWPQGMERPRETQPVPDTLDWNLWLGVAPERPYNRAYAPFAWRGWWDFGCGALGDIGCHAMDAAFYALELGSPSSVEAVSSPVNSEAAPQWSIVTYQFPARGNHPPVKVIWHDGNKQPPRPKDLEADRELPGEIGGSLLFGDAGTIMVSDAYCSSFRIIPEAKMKEYAPKRPPKTLPRSPGHVQEWIQACKGGPAPGANFDYAGPLSEMVLLGNLAVRSGTRVEWDGANLICTNLPAANQYVRHPYRLF